jgi:hypothetical protein
MREGRGANMEGQIEFCLEWGGQYSFARNVGRTEGRELTRRPLGTIKLSIPRSLVSTFRRKLLEDSPEEEEEDELREGDGKMGGEKKGGQSDERGGAEFTRDV